MKTRALPLVGIVIALLLPMSLEGQQMPVDAWRLDVAGDAASAEAKPTFAARRGFGGNPWLRTLATLAAASGGYMLGEELIEPGTSDVQYGPIAAGAGAAALAGMLFSDGHPLKIIAGAALSTLPSAALSTFLAGSLDDDEEGQIPLIAFSIPQGLLTSAFAQDPRR